MPEYQTRATSPKDFRAAEEDGKKYIEAYFAVFGDVYQMSKYATESIAPEAFNDTLSDDIRALINHDKNYVLGRTKVGTLSLEVNNYGLRGRIEINDDDQDAVNAYHRVKRGDISQCSIGFDVVEEVCTERDDGTYHWTLKKLRLYEVSIVTFPAYEQTEAHARTRARHMVREFEAWKATLAERIKGC